VEPDPAQAAKEKTASRIALERGRLGAAIEAGERSVALDPTDGEAWLILGAAYQTKGNAKDARRCYKTCIEQAKRGPRGECAAMLR
jgi:Flp pilus assembly protein TadD